MATIAETVYTRCTTHIGLAALIGARCYPDMLKEDVVEPAVVFSRVSMTNAPFRTHDLGPTTLVNSRFQFDGYADTPKGARDVGDQVYAAWDGYRDACVVGSAFVANRGTEYDDGFELYRDTVDVVILHSIS